MSFSPAPNLDDPPVSDLFLLDPGSATPRQVPGSSGITDGTSWSPDGTRLAFATGKLCTVKADGTDLTEVALEPGVAACWAEWGRTAATSLPRPSASPAPGATPAPQPFHRGQLDPGTYVTDIFDPHMQFRVGTGWVALSNYLDGLSLGRPEFSLNELDVGRVQVVFDTPCLTGSTRTIGSTAREFFDFIQQNPYLEVGDPRPVILGGRTGLSIDVLVARMPTAATCPGESEGQLNKVFLFQTGQGSFWFGGQHRVRVVSIDVASGPAVTFVYGGDPEGADAFIKLAQSIIGSLTFP